MPIALRARLPLARHILATVLLAGAAASYYGYSAMHGGLWRDPAATLLYPIGVLGLALGMFWARYFVICFCASLAAIRLGGADWYAAWSYPWLWLQVGGPLALAVLLAGKSMRQRFEGRAGGWLNRWSELLESRLDLQLRALIVAQSVALGLVYGWRQVAPSVAATVVVLGVLSMLGLLLLRTAALLPLVAAFVAQGLFVAELLQQPYVTNAHRYGLPLMLGVALLASTLAIAPLVHKAATVLRSERSERA